MGRIDNCEAEARRLVYSHVGRQFVERTLGVSARRALQLMSGLPGQPFGQSLAVERAALLKRLRSIAAGEDNSFESERRAQFAAKLDAMRRERIEHPRVEVEAPISVVNSRLESLPAGVTVEPGRIAVSCASAEQALERLLALVMAIGNDLTQFEAIVSKG